MPPAAKGQKHTTFDDDDLEPEFGEGFEGEEMNEFDEKDEDEDEDEDVTRMTRAKRKMTTQARTSKRLPRRRHASRRGSRPQAHRSARNSTFLY